MKQLNFSIITCFFGSIICILALATTSGNAQSPSKPNIILIITDDQGYGDFGFTGNPHVRTPHLDQLAGQSIRFENFYVSPVCAPTRSSLLTGRYSLRTGVHDTYNGGAIMATEEITIAEMMKEGGYQTGIFGKWHLGDNYPSRPGDQGFDESLIHLSGGMGQVGDVTTYFQGDSSYFDPVLWHNDQTQQYSGYCSDIFTTAAIEFIEAQRNHPFFCYLSFNAPHTPLQVPDQYLERYRDIDPSTGFEGNYPELEEMTERDKETARKVYAMVDNIDENLGRLLNRLDELGIADQTWIVFLTDNGPQQVRYNAGMRGRKSSVYQGGVRVPFLIRPPQALVAPREVESVGAHIDVLPTIAQICGLPVPGDRIIDGKSLFPLINGEQDMAEERELFFYWSRRYPEKYYNMAYQQGAFKLVGHTDYDADISEFELFDLASDPQEQQNLVHQNPELAQRLKAKLDSTYEDLIASQNIHDHPLIYIGHPAENPVILNRNDAAGARGIWSQSEIYGYWSVRVQPGTYDLRFRFLDPIDAPGRIILETGPQVLQKTIEPSGQVLVEMQDVPLPAITRGQMTAFFQQENREILPFWIELTKVGE